jgi:hypothetical protein
VRGKFEGKVNALTDVDVEPIVDERRIKTFDLLVIPPQQTSIYFIIDSSRNDPSDSADHGKTYYYDEHTCPTNWLQSVEEVISDGDDDPHGLGQFVRSVDATGLGESPDWQTIFPEAFGGKTIEGDLVVGRLAKPE